MSNENSEGKLNRRQFLKASGAAGAALGSAGLGFFGYESGKDPGTYTGWETYEGINQTFDRSKWEVDSPVYKIVGTTSRPDSRVEVTPARVGRLRNQWNDDTGLAGLEEILQEYYKKHPEVLELDLLHLKEILPKLEIDKKNMLTITYLQSFIHMP